MLLVEVTSNTKVFTLSELYFFLEKIPLSESSLPADVLQTFRQFTGPIVTMPYSNLFKEQWDIHCLQDERIRRKFWDFMKFKFNNPLQPYGGTDTGFKAIFPHNMKHAHLTHDLSIFYTISGQNPRVINLYGIYSHAESGTGTPANIHKMQSLANRFAHATFTRPDFEQPAVNQKPQKTHYDWRAEQAKYSNIENQENQ